MADTNGWVIENMRRLAQRESRLLGPRRGRQGRKLTEKQQVLRFLAGSEIERVRSGEITPTQYHQYQRRMLKKVYNVEVD
jgi:hypothetical protein